MKTIDERLTTIIEELIQNGITFEQATEAFEKKFIRTGIVRSRGNITRAALLLGVHRNTLHNRLRGWRSMQRWRR